MTLLLGGAFPRSQFSGFVVTRDSGVMTLVMRLTSRLQFYRKP
jgi:hypothetical protein